MLRSGGLSVLMLAMIGCAAGSEPTLAACLNKGHAYYKSAGDYPTSRDGRDAKGMAQEHCELSPTAFDSVG
jgi:hypothetical protein